MKRLRLAGISAFAHYCYLRSVRAVGPRAPKLRRGFLMPTTEYRGDPPTGFPTWMGAPALPTDGSGDHHLHYGNYLGTPNDIALGGYEFVAYTEPITELNELATGVEAVPFPPPETDLPDTAEVASDQTLPTHPGPASIPRRAAPDPAPSTRSLTEPIPCRAATTRPTRDAASTHWDMGPHDPRADAWRRQAGPEAAPRDQAQHMQQRSAPAPGARSASADSRWRKHDGSLVSEPTKLTSTGSTSGSHHARPGAVKPHIMPPPAVPHPDDLEPFKIMVDFRVTAVSSFKMELTTSGAIEPHRDPNCPALRPCILTVGPGLNDRIVVSQTAPEVSTTVNTLSVHDLFALNGVHSLPTDRWQLYWKTALSCPSVRRRHMTSALPTDGRAGGVSTLDQYPFSVSRLQDGRWHIGSNPSTPTQNEAP